MEQQISLATARDLVSRLKAAPVDGLPVSETFNAEIVRAILDNTGCTGLRIYPGKKADGSIVFVLAGADAQGNDLVEVLGEDGFRCPPFCAAEPIIYL